MELTWNNLDTLESFKKLQSLKGQVHLKDVLGADRVSAYGAQGAQGLMYNYAAKQVNEQILSVMQELADEAQLTEKFTALYEGEVINTGEKRKVLHHLLRGPKSEPPMPICTTLVKVSPFSLVIFPE